MVKILGGVLLFRASRYEDLLPSDISSWPLAKRGQKFFLDCGGSDTAKVLVALEEVEKRRDFDGLLLGFLHLLDDKIRAVLERLFKIENKSWDMHLRFKSPLPASVNRARLLNVLSILQPMRYIHFLKEGDIAAIDQLKVLQCLPNFDKLEYMDFRGWRLDQHALQETLDCPFLPSCTKVFLDPILPLDDPVFPDETACRIHSITLHNLDTMEPEVASTVLRAVALLPVLNELSVTLPTGDNAVYAEPLSIFYTWLQSPKCRLTSLIIDPGTDVEEQRSLFFATIPKIPLLEALRWDRHLLHLYLEDFLQAISSAPKLNCIYVDCRMDNTLPRKLLKFQLDCRPRMVSFVSTSGLELCEAVSFVYQVMGAFQQSSEGGFFPNSVWPYFLECLGDSMFVRSRAVNKVGLDAIFQMLKKLLSSYTWEWTRVLSVGPVHYTDRKRRRS